METVSSLQLNHPQQSNRSQHLTRPRCCPRFVAHYAPLLAVLVTACTATFAQQTAYSAANLDPARDPASLKLERSLHTPLPEQYIWVAGVDAGAPAPRGVAAPERYFRRTFTLASVPSRATLYVAGPGTVRVYVNGAEVGAGVVNPDTELTMRTFAFDVAHALHAGTNVIAIAGTRDAGHGFGSDDPGVLAQERGRVLVVKLLPEAPGRTGKALLISDGSWKGSTESASGWETASFNDSAWKPVQSFGGIESNINFFQANTDAGLYAWPGYDGISPFLGQYTLRPAKVEHIGAGLGAITGADSLTAPGASLQIKLPGATETLPDSPQVLLDFGREVVGRLHVVSSVDTPEDVVVQYGESEDEALQDPYLGPDPIHVAEHGAAYGPKSAFRYALVRFVGGQQQGYSALDLAGIAYPVTWKGSFESSDPMLNEAWAVGAYTAHLCMQDDIWDAPKRDRARWMGDLDVSGRTIEDAFGDTFLMEHTLDALLGSHPDREDVNSIPGYSAFWFTGEEEYYKTHDAKAQLAALHPRMVGLVHRMASELNSADLFANAQHGWPFVDWSPELHDDTPEARRATQMEFYAAFRAAQYLLQQAGDTKEASFAADAAQKMDAAAQAHLLDADGSYGTRWQTNAFAVLSGVATPAQYPAIWKNALASVGHVKYNALIITPYYNYYVISAMAQMNHRAAALDWIRQYWGGMLAEGASSFWEGYMPDWYKDPFHESLQADQMSGFRVSLAHGWSTGVTPWLTEQVLGVRSTGPGYQTVDIRPDLVDLGYAKGTVPTPHGVIGVSITKNGAQGLQVALDLPAGVRARVLLPGEHVTLNGGATQSTPAEGGARLAVMVAQAGHSTLASE